MTAVRTPANSVAGDLIAGGRGAPTVSSPFIGPSSLLYVLTGCLLTYCWENLKVC